MRRIWKFLFAGEQEKGQSIVELALALPVLLMIMGGVLDFGWIYMNQYRVENAAYAGARYASIHAEELDSGALNTAVTNQVKSNLPGRTTGCTVTVSTSSDRVSVTVDLPVRTLTFVGSGLFGDKYHAVSTSVAPLSPY